MQISKGTLFGFSSEVWSICWKVNQTNFFGFLSAAQKGRKFDSSQTLYKADYQWYKIKDLKLRDLSLRKLNSRKKSCIL